MKMRGWRWGGRERWGKIRRKSGNVKVSNSGQRSCRLATFMGRHPKRRGQSVRVVRARAKGLQGTACFRWAGKGRGIVGKGMVAGHNISLRGLYSGLAFSLFLCTHAGYHLKGNLSSLYLLKLYGAWIRQEINEGCGPLGGAESHPS